MFYPHLVTGHRNPSPWVAWLTVGATIPLAVITVIVAIQKPPNLLAAGLLQGITLIFGAVGSFLSGKASARDAGAEMIRPHARSAFRRVTSLYAALGRLRNEIGAQ